jgi:hypothetical protein
VTDDIVAFIRARLDEEAVTAVDALMGGAGKWAQEDPDRAAGSIVDESLENDRVVYDEGRPTGEQAAHIARHDPARVLRAVEAKRRIVARYEDCMARMEDDDYPTAEAADQAREYENWTLPALASECSDHADYRTEWTP